MTRRDGFTAASPTALSIRKSELEKPAALCRDLISTSDVGRQAVSPSDIRGKGRAIGVVVLFSLMVATTSRISVGDRPQYLMNCWP
jgi:hypothetical protein